MKIAPVFLLSLSVVGNAAGLVWLLCAAPAPAVPAPAPRVAAQPVAAPPGLAAGTWAKLRHEDPRVFVAQLRAAGFPPDLVRAMLAASIYSANAARWKTLNGGDDARFWREPAPDREAMMAMRQLGREQAKLLRDILGDDSDGHDESLGYSLRATNFLPPEKAAEIRRLQREFDERRSDLFAANPAYDREKIQALEREQRDAIMRTLTPAELVEYDLRNHNTAGNLREELSVFDPTEAEFRALFALRSAFDDQFNRGDLGGSQTAEQQRQRADAEALLREQIRAQLGAERAAQYERMTDNNYRRTSQLIARLELPPATTEQLYALQKEYEQRRIDFYRGGALQREQVTAEMTTLQAEAIARVTPLLRDARGVEAYKQYGGAWLNSMVPRPATGTGIRAMVPAPPPTR